MRCSAVNFFFQRFARLELNRLSCSNGNSFTCLRVATLTFCAFPDGKSPETYKSDILACFETISHNRNK